MTVPHQTEPSPGARGHGRRVLRNTGVLSLSGLVVRALAMVMLVVIARSLGAELFGQYQRAEAFVFMFSILTSLGLDMILTREVAARSARAREYFGVVMRLKAVLGPGCLAVVFGLALARGYDIDFLWSIGCFGLVLLLNSLAQTYDAVFQGLDDMVYVAVTSITSQAVFVALGIVVVWLGRGHPAQHTLRWILVMLVAAALLRLGLSVVLLARVRLVPSPRQPGTMGYLLRQSLPIAAATSFVLVYQQLDAVLLGEMKGNTEVGWYKASAKLLLIFTTLRESFLTAVYPVFSRAAREGSARLGDLVTRAVRFQLIGALYFVLCFVLLPQVAKGLLGSDFRNSSQVLPVLAMVLIPQTISITMGRMLIAAGHQSRIVVATAIALGLNVTLNLLLIPRYGYMGAATAAAVSELAVAVVNVWYVRRYVARTQVLRSLAKPLLAAVAVGAVLRALPALRLVAALPLAGVLYLAALLALRAFSRREIADFWVLARESIERLKRTEESEVRTLESS